MRVRTEALEHRNEGQVPRGRTPTITCNRDKCLTWQPTAKCDANYAGEDDWLVFHGFFPELFSSALNPTVGRGVIGCAFRNYMRNAR